MPTTIPAAVDAVIALGRAVLPSSVQIIDGQVGTYVSAEQFEVTGVNGDQAWATLGAKAREETYTVECMLRVYAGDEDVQARRRRVFALLALIEQGLAADYTLGGVVRWAEPGGIGLEQGRTDKGGTAADLTFEVRCRARIHNGGIAP